MWSGGTAVVNENENDEQNGIPFLAFHSSFFYFNSNNHDGMDLWIENVKNTRTFVDIRLLLWFFLGILGGDGRKFMFVKNKKKTKAKPSR